MPAPRRREHRRNTDKSADRAYQDKCPIDKRGPARRAARLQLAMNFAGVIGANKPCDAPVRIPTKPAMHSNLKPATYTDLKPATVPI
jgi:hypothetical protein